MPIGLLLCWQRIDGVVRFRWEKNAQVVQVSHTEKLNILTRSASRSCCFNLSKGWGAEMAAARLLQYNTIVIKEISRFPAKSFELVVSFGFI